MRNFRRWIPHDCMDYGVTKPEVAVITKILS
jgi:hypothetical protein